MAVTMHPYLSFPENNIREAFTRYAEIFGGEPQFMPLSGMTNLPDDADLVMHAELRTPDFRLMGADNCGRQQLTQGNAFAVALMAGKEDEQRMRDAFDKLAERGAVHMPMEKQEWGDVYGELTDTFGVQWAINVGQED